MVSAAVAETLEAQAVEEEEAKGNKEALIALVRSAMDLSAPIPCEAQMDSATAASAIKKAKIVKNGNLSSLAASAADSMEIDAKDKVAPIEPMSRQMLDELHLEKEKIPPFASSSSNPLTTLKTTRNLLSCPPKTSPLGPQRAFAFLIPQKK